MFDVNLEPLINQIKQFTQAQQETNKLLLEIKEIMYKHYCLKDQLLTKK